MKELFIVEITYLDTDNESSGAEEKFLNRREAARTIDRIVARGYAIIPESGSENTHYIPMHRILWMCIVRKEIADGATT